MRFLKLFFVVALLGVAAVLWLRSYLRDAELRREEALKTMPVEFSQHARNVKQDVLDLCPGLEGELGRYDDIRYRELGAYQGGHLVVTPDGRIFDVVGCTETSWVSR